MHFLGRQVFEGDGPTKGYNFDWDDWERFARDSAPNLRRLYLVMSTFYQFGYSLHMEFCAGLLNDVDSIHINTALGESHNLPIYKRGSHLFLLDMSS